MQSENHTNANGERLLLRLEAEIASQIGALQRRASAGGWSHERFATAASEVYLTYYRAISDPNNSEITRAYFDRVLQSYTRDNIPWSRPNIEQYPELYTIVADITDQLNQLHGVNFPSPNLIITNNLQTSAGFSLPGDALLFDSENLELFHRDPDTLRSLIAHELAHRYQRDTTRLMLRVRENFFPNEPISRQDKHQNHFEEIKADYFAARLTSAQATGRMLENAFLSSGLIENQFFREQMQLPDNTSSEEVIRHLLALPANRRQELQRSFRSLNAEDLDALSKRALLQEDRHDDTSTHPSYLDRQELQAILSLHPELLGSNIRLDFDTEANIVSVLDGSVSYTPNQISELNQEGDKVIGVRTQN